jgi:hypothetical protein
LPIIACRVIARSRHSEAIRPRRTLIEGEEISEYLFCKTRLVGGEGLILPSTLLVPRELFRDAGLRFGNVSHEGSDWLMRAVRRKGVGVEFVATDDPLAIWNCEESRSRISTRSNWRATLAWANAATSLLTPRAHASFILNRVSIEARRVGDLGAFWRLTRESFRKGRPTPISLLAHALRWLMPRRVRSSLASYLNRRSLVWRDPTRTGRPGAAKPDA